MRITSHPIHKPSVLDDKLFSLYVSSYTFFISLADNISLLSRLDATITDAISIITNTKAVILFFMWSFLLSYFNSFKLKSIMVLRVKILFDV